MGLLDPSALAPSRRLRAAAVAMFATLGSGLGLGVDPASGQAPGPALEYAVKANYLYKLGPFVGWPRSAFASATSPFNVCVLGQDPFGRILDDAVVGQAVDGHPIAVRRPPSALSAAGCHILYVGRGAPEIGSLRGAPTLVVTDQRNGGARGMVHFVLRDGRVRFILDARAAQAGGLTLGSKLQVLATAERPGERP